MVQKVEYRVRPVARYIVTRFEQDYSDDGNGCTAGSSSAHGVFDNFETAYHVAYALCRQEHQASGQPAESVNFIYPVIPEDVSIPPQPLG